MRSAALGFGSAGRQRRDLATARAERCLHKAIALWRTKPRPSFAELAQSDRRGELANVTVVTRANQLEWWRRRKASALCRVQVAIASGDLDEGLAMIAVTDIVQPNSRTGFQWSERSSSILGE